MRKRPIGFAVWTLFLASAVLAQTGTLTYPAEDNLRFSEGTIEFWMKIPFDAQERISADKYAGLLSIVRMEGESGALNWIWYTGASYKGSAGLACSQGSTKAKLHTFMLGKWMPKPNEWHHFALTWKGRTFTAYINAEKRGGAECLEPIHFAYGAAGEKPIFFGDPWGKRGEMVLDEFRISSIARDPKELGFHGRLVPDPYTLLLDDYEQSFKPDGKTQTKPVVTFTGAGGTPSAACEFVEGKFGMGLALYRSKANEQGGEKK